MPLFPAPTYTAWQLACIAAIQPLNAQPSDGWVLDAEILGELRLRGIEQSDVDQMVALAGKTGAYLLPMVCMDVDDLEQGITAQAVNGVISEAERQRLLSFVAAHLDLPREPRVVGPPRRGKWQWVSDLGNASIVLGFGLGCIAKSGVAFCLWLGWFFVVIWLQQVAPRRCHRLRFWYARRRQSRAG